MDRRHFLFIVLASGTAWPMITNGFQLSAPKDNRYESYGWEPIGFSGGGSMFTPVISPIDPQLMMLNCDMSCAFLSYDGGLNWRMIHHSQLRGNTRCRPAFHPKDIDVLFAAHGGSGRLRVSRDRGVTWSAIGDIKGRLAGEIAINPDHSDIMLTSADEKVWRSEDGGHHWNPVEGPQGTLISFHFDRPQPGTVFAATEAGFWRSDDAGKTWIDDLTVKLPGKSLQGFKGGSHKESNTIILYCTVASTNQNGFAGGVYRSRDRGETWESAMGSGIDQEIIDGEVPQYYHVLTNDQNPNIVYVFSRGSTYSPPHHSTCYRSDDAGQTWKATFFGNPQWDQFNLEHNYHTVYMGTNSDGVPIGAAIAPSDSNIVITTDSMECHITTNGGKNWFNGHSRPAVPERETPKEFLNTGLVVTSTWHYYIDPFQRQRHYIAYTDIGFARSLDAGKTWRFWPSWARHKQIPWYNTCYELAFDPEIPGKIWGAFSNVHDIPNGNVITGTHWNRLPENERIGGIAFSSDFAENWRESNQGLPPSAACSVVLDPKSPVGKRTLYAAIYTKGVYKSTDDGKTWISKSQGLGSTVNRRACRVILHEDGTLFCMITALYKNREFSPDGVGLYRSRDEGESWERISQSPILLWLKDFTVHPQNSKEIYIGACDIRSGEEQGGLWRTEDGGMTWKRIARKGPQHFGAYLHPTKPGWIYMSLCEAAPEAGLWLSKDNGETWQPFESLPFCNIQRITFDPDDEDTMYVTTFGGSVFKGATEPD